MTAYVSHEGIINKGVVRSVDISTQSTIKNTCIDTVCNSLNKDRGIRCVIHHELNQG